MKKYLITIQYDGKNYYGFQKQENEKNTIQEVLEREFSALFDEKIEIFASGRTDAGVSALAQTAHFESSTTIPTEKIPFAINERLPKDIKVYPSEANYVMVDLKKRNSLELTVRLLDKYNLIIKDLSSKYKFEYKNFVRLAVRDRKDNDFLIEVLKKEL